MITIDDWSRRAAALRDELAAAGKLTDPRWQAALLAVPRHQFVPEFYERTPAGWKLSRQDVRTPLTSGAARCGQTGRW